MKRFLLPYLLFFLSAEIHGQIAHDTAGCRFFQPFAGYKSWTSPAKGTFYLTWGYNKDAYTKTDVRVHSSDEKVDFTLYDMTARDHAQWKDILRVQPSIPQYDYRLGYWLPNGKFGIEANFDHAKYIVNDWQHVHMNGNIYGEHFDTDTTVDPDHFLHLEHTDGANLLMLNLMFRAPLFASTHAHLFWIAKAGAGVVIPRSDVTLWGLRWNHCFHIAGPTTGIETGFRLEFYKYFFFEPTIKGAYCDFKNVLARDNILISHQFFAGMGILCAGFQVPLGK
ncbi:MAG TPA: hypothetical protein VFU15_07280 [Bacteroidia bacterium]|nr:hypothetical protein [Bacteroidia bacterium]